MIGIMPKTAEINNGHVIIEPAQVRRATDEEMELYAKLVEQASKKQRLFMTAKSGMGKKH